MGAKSKIIQVVYFVTITLLLSFNVTANDDGSLFRKVSSIRGQLESEAKNVLITLGVKNKLLLLCKKSEGYTFNNEDGVLKAIQVVFGKNSFDKSLYMGEIQSRINEITRIKEYCNIEESIYDTETDFEVAGEEMVRGLEYLKSLMRNTNSKTLTALNAAAFKSFYDWANTIAIAKIKSTKSLPKYFKDKYSRAGFTHALNIIEGWKAGKVKYLPIQYLPAELSSEVNKRVVVVIDDKKVIQYMKKERLAAWLLSGLGKPDWFLTKHGDFVKQKVN
ncbi:hypothetical protein [Aliikangiella sp. IMCC44359]|uniref:hypothetical protein n=1 Tax=Aliikangiella sp. IMCC44359 TaxID=3459125 RepID=UPI00403B365F